jgi:hypothetical protein
MLTSLLLGLLFLDMAGSPDLGQLERIVYVVIGLVFLLIVLVSQVVLLRRATIVGRTR